MRHLRKIQITTTRHIDDIMGLTMPLQLIHHVKLPLPPTVVKPPRPLTTELPTYLPNDASTPPNPLPNHPPTKTKPNIIINNNNPNPATMPSPPPTLTYIPPLRDGASGTTPRSQHPLLATIRHELTHTLRLLPTLCWALLFQRRHRGTHHPHHQPHHHQHRRPQMSRLQIPWTDTAETALYLLLACFEVEVLLAAVPLWVVLPGVGFAVWVGGCAGVVAAGCKVLNAGRGEQWVYGCDAVDSGGGGGGVGADGGWMMGQEMEAEAEDEKWLFLGGMGMRYVLVFFCCFIGVLLSGLWGFVVLLTDGVVV